MAQLIKYNVCVKIHRPLRLMKLVKFDEKVNVDNYKVIKLLMLFSKTKALFLKFSALIRRKLIIIEEILAIL